MRWWRELWAGRRNPAAPAPAPAHAADGSPAAPPPDAPDPDHALLAWLLHSGLPRPEPLDAAEAQAIAQLDALLRASRTPGDLLPRAPAVIPQLLSALRQGDASLPAMSQRVIKDLPLTAEVLRQASSAAYGQGPVTELEQALALLGTDGLKQVIARVVLRPLFDGHAGRFSGLAAARVWACAEAQARCAATLAAEQGLDPFDGYLGGLVHSTGWIAAFRVLDRLDKPPALPFSRSFAARLLPRKDALFAKVVAAWQLTPALTALCSEAGELGLAQARSPLAAVLVQAQQRAATELLRDAA